MAALSSPGVASRTGMLWLESARWQHRRVDTVEFGDEETLRWRSSIDFTVPEQAADLRSALGVHQSAYQGTQQGTPDPTASRLLPLALLRKSPLVDFDLRDEADAALPMLTAEQNGALSTGVLVAVAESLLGAAPHPALVRDLEAIALAPGGSGEAALHRLSAGASVGEERRQRERLRQSQTFVGLARQLADGFVLAVLLPDPPGTRRVVKFRQEQRFDLGGLSRRRGLAAALGWAPTPAPTMISHASDSRSYHFEAVAPPAVEITDLRFLLRWPGQLQPAAAPARVAGGRSRAHAAVAYLTKGSDLEAVVGLRAERRGWLRASCLLSLAALALLSLLLWRGSYVSWSSPTGRTSTNSIATLLLALNGVLAALLVRTGEHALASRLLSRLRLAALASAGLPFLVAVTLVFGPQGSALTWLLRGYLVVSLVAATVLTLGYLLPRARGPLRTGRGP